MRPDKIITVNFLPLFRIFINYYKIEITLKRNIRYKLRTFTTFIKTQSGDTGVVRAKLNFVPCYSGFKLSLSDSCFRPIFISRVIRSTRLFREIRARHIWPTTVLHFRCACM